MEFEFPRFGTCLNICLHLIAITACALHFTNVNDIAVFILACLGLVPIAGLIGDLTETIEEKTQSPIIAALVNSAGGNSPELFFGLFSLFHGEDDFLIGILVGSIVSNCLLVLGMSIAIGSWKHKNQSCSPKVHPIHVTGALTLLVSTSFYVMCSVAGNQLSDANAKSLNLIVSGILLVNYVVNNIFTYVFSQRMNEEFISPMVRQASSKRVLQASRRSEKILSTPSPNMTDHSTREITLEFPENKSPAALPAIPDSPSPTDSDGEEPMSWTRVAMCTVYGIIIMAILSEAVTSRVSVIVSNGQVSARFVGGIIIALLGNACEHWSSVSSAQRGSLDVSIQICMSSALQISMLIYPLFVWASLGRDNFFYIDLDLIYQITLLLSPLIVYLTLVNIRQNFYLGFMLCSLYCVIAALYFVS